MVELMLSLSKSGIMEAFTDVTKTVEAFGLENVLRFSQWEYCRQISVSIILMSCEFSQPIRMG